MKGASIFSTCPKHAKALFLLFILVGIAYFNTLNTSWHLDDLPNILYNKHIRSLSWSPETWLQAIRSPLDPDKRIYRPVAMLTFAFNWSVGGQKVLGYHLVNTGIHLASGSLLFLTILQLLRSPNLMGRYRGNQYFLAFFGAVLWAIHPIQTQAVTYIVQRMASLAAMFYLLAIYLYIKGRCSPERGRRSLIFAACLAAFILALGTKENTSTLPLALLLVEVVFFLKPGSLSQPKIRWIIAGVLLFLTVFLVFLAYFWLGDPIDRILRGYRGRPFTIEERLFTESRILLFYLSQLFYPAPQRFSIMHEFELSTSLLNPWTTLISIIIILSLIGLALHSIRKRPLMSFAILFFFLTQSIESTIIPLELVFEHRNYLPSLFIFLPIVSGVQTIIEAYKIRNRRLASFLKIFSFLIVISLVFATHMRNSVWQNEKTLWQDALINAPSYARPYQNVAMYYSNTNRLDEAIELYNTALNLKDPNPDFSRFICLSNIGNIYKKKLQFDKAAEYLRAAIAFRGGAGSTKVRYNLVLCLLNSNGLDEALKHMNWLLAKNKNNSRFLATRGFIFIKLGDYEAAFHDLQLALKSKPEDINGLLNMAMTLSSIGKYQQAEKYLQRANQQDPQNMVILLAMLENAVKEGKRERTKQYLDSIIISFEREEVRSFLSALSKGYIYSRNTMVPVDPRVVSPLLSDYIN